MKSIVLMILEQLQHLVAAGKLKAALIVLAALTVAMVAWVMYGCGGHYRDSLCMDAQHNLDRLKCEEFSVSEGPDGVLGTADDLTYGELCEKLQEAEAAFHLTSQSQCIAGAKTCEEAGECE